MILARLNNESKLTTKELEHVSGGDIDLSKIKPKKETCVAVYEVCGTETTVKFVPRPVRTVTARYPNK